MADDSTQNDEIELHFDPLTVMPTSRLNDILNILENKTPSIINLDALIPAKEAGEVVLQTLLYKLPSSVKVLSLRFNNFNAFCIEELIQWLAENNHLEMLYLMGSGIDEKNRLQIESAWKKNLENHRTDNMGYTFIRVTSAVVQKAQEELLAT